MENMSLMDKIKIGMLGVIIVLQLVQMSGVLGGGSSSSSIREQAAQDLSAPAGVTPMNPPTAFNQGGIQQPVPNQPVQPPTPPVPSGPKTNINFTESAYDFGSVNAGEKVEHVYKFKNTGNEPLIISDAKGSCGCTVPEWPKNPIAPGKSGEIKVVFDSKGKSGKINNQVTLTANTEPATTVIRITGEVISKGGDAAANPAVNPIQVQPGGK